MDSVVGTFVTCRQQRAARAEDSDAARICALPRPNAIPARQSLDENISLTIEEMGAILAGCGIVTDNLQSSDTNIANAAICRMHHEMTSGRPLIHIAGDNRHGRGAGCRDGFSFGEP